MTKVNFPVKANGNIEESHTHARQKPGDTQHEVAGCEHLGHQQRLNSTSDQGSLTYIARDLVEDATAPLRDTGLRAQHCSVRSFAAGNQSTTRLVIDMNKWLNIRVQIFAVRHSAANTSCACKLTNCRNNCQKQTHPTYSISPHMHYLLRNALSSWLAHA